DLGASGIEVDAVGLSDSGAFTSSPLEAITHAARGRLVQTSSISGLTPLVVALSQARLSSTYAVDVPLPRSSSRDLQLSVRGSTFAHVALPSGVAAPSESLLIAHGGVVVAVLAFFALALLTHVFLTRGADRPL